MIINNAESTATIIGDVQTNSVSIDINNIGFITQLLSTNLYSKPIDSFLREIVSNAWDSHVEIGNDEPILLEIGTDTEGRDYCRIQDFGIGLSPERFNDIYKNIGSSTKRGDNKQIGGFGIGRFSALAYSGTVYLTSNYQGVKYKYLMYKDGNNIKIDELFNDVTTDKDGLEVLVYLKSYDIYDFKKAISSQLPYFENLYISFDRYWNKAEREFANKFNNLKIKKYKTFSVNTFSSSSETTLCLGKIQYPLNKSSLHNTKFKFSENYPISVNFEIGDLDVTPNREQILYSQKNVKTICEKLDEVQDEIDEIVKTATSRDCTNLNDYINILKSGNQEIILYNDGGDIIKFYQKLLATNITYCGQKYNKEVVTKLYDFMFDNNRKFKKYYSFKYYDQKLWIKDDIYLPPFKQLLDTNGLQFAKYSDLNNLSKSFIRSTYTKPVYFFKKEKPYKFIKDLVKIIKKEIDDGYLNFTFDSIRDELKILLKYLFEKLSTIPEFTNNDVPKTYTLTRKNVNSTNTSKAIVDTINWKEELNLFVLRSSEKSIYGTLSVTSDAKRVSMDKVKTEWHNFQVIYAEKDNILLRRLYYLFKELNNYDFKKYKFVEIAPTKKHLLKQFPNFIEINDYMDIKYKKLRMIATARLLKERYPYINTLYFSNHINKQFSMQLSNVVKEVYEYIRINTLSTYYEKQVSSLLEDIDKMCADKNFYDEEMMGFVNKNHKLLENSKFLTLISGSLSDDTVNFITDYILVKKLFTPNLDAVKKLRKETIFNKKENENN